MSFLILPEWIIVRAGAPPLQHWGVRVVDDVIDDVAPAYVLMDRYPKDETFMAPGEILSPGFVNTHSHLYGVLAHGIPMTKAPSDFWAFLEEFWWPLVENALDPSMINAATDLRCADMLKSGVTSFYDCTEAPNALPGCLFAQAEVVKKWGMRAILSFEATERMSKENGLLGLKENADFTDACKKENGLVQGLICHHTTFTCSEEFILKAFALAQERGVLLHAHVSEGTYEPEYMLRTQGMRTIEYYNKLGIAGNGFLASQCVQLSPEEVEIIANKGVHACHMPLSNCEVGGGIAPIPELIKAKATVGLGTDGYIDDFFEVMRGAFLIHKAHQQNPQVMPANLVWYMATEGGAKVLNLEKVGRIEKGWKADLQLIKGDVPTPIEAHNLYDQMLLYRGAKDVRAVWVNGQLKVSNGEVSGADWDALKAHTHEAACCLWAKAR
ncbi:MAG: amidohydrolase family protein [Anaerolineaceae bacterium]